MDNEIVMEEPRYSGKLQLIFENGTIQYDEQIGPPDDFPLTEAERTEVQNAK